MPFVKRAKSLAAQLRSNFQLRQNAIVKWSKIIVWRRSAWPTDMQIFYDDQLILLLKIYNFGERYFSDSTQNLIFVDVIFYFSSKFFIGNFMRVSLENMLSVRQFHTNLTQFSHQIGLLTLRLQYIRNQRVVKI